MEYARFASKRGRYRPPCTGECVQVGEGRTSGLETEIFHWLSFVLGRGRQDVQFPEDRRMRVDMVFDLTPDVRLAVEYDGAYWHAGREEADRRKSHRLVNSGFVTGVLRIREHPLDVRGPLEVAVDTKPPAHQVVQLVLLHLLHEFEWAAGRSDEICAFLRSAAQKLPLAIVRCRPCYETARYLQIIEPGPGPVRRRRRPRRFRAD